jgi:large conductance mechanosensitive channel
MVKEFRDFIMRGNIVDLAVAVVIGVAFGAVITSFVTNIITPLLGLLGLPDFSTWIIDINIGAGASLAVGTFLNALISFLAIALAIFLFVIKPMNALAARSKKPEAAAPAAPSELDLLTEIRDELRKRAA